VEVLQARGDSEYARGRREESDAAAGLRERAAAADRLEADLARSMAALQEQLMRASSFDESQMLDRRIVKKLFVRDCGCVTR
jgi:hypothetical protein